VTKKQIIIIVAAIVLLLGMGFVYMSVSTPAGQTVASVPDEIFPSDIVLGKADAKVTVIEYASPSCPHCALWEQQIFPQLKTAYIDTGKIRFVYRFFLLPQFPHDPDVARLTLCQPKEQQHDFIDMMYRNHPQWNKTFYPDIEDDEAALVRMGTGTGMSDDRVAECRKPNKAVDDEINRLAALGQAKGVDSTPSFVVDGALVAPEFEKLSAAIEAALVK
jgi:protein-disulfide isomerase